MRAALIAGDVDPHDPRRRLHHSKNLRRVRARLAIIDPDKGARLVRGGPAHEHQGRTAGHERLEARARDGRHQNVAPHRLRAHRVEILVLQFRLVVGVAQEHHAPRRPEVTPHVSGLIKFRPRLIPYFYDLLWKYHDRYEPMIRPTFHDFPEDPRCFEENDDMLLGA